MFENRRSSRQARNFTTNVPKILDLKSSSEQIFFRKLSLGAPDRMSLITCNAKEYRSVTAQLMSQNLPIVSCSFGIFCVILTISYLRAQTIETSSLPTDSSRLLFKQIEIFFYTDCMTVYFNCKYFP